MLIFELLENMHKLEASDLHLGVGSPPIFRIKGKLKALNFPPLTNDMIRSMVFALLTSEQIEQFEKQKELDFSYSLENTGRFRGNLYFQKGTIAAAIRSIPYKIRSIEELGLPQILEQMASFERGLFLVTGPTGVGKSTTLAAMIEYINNNFSKHIITIEDPIEYVYINKKSIIHQREIGVDTHSFHEALRHVLRQDPDVIMIGEMRDIESISLALTAAETGHLVFSTLHTFGIVNTIDRIVDAFPAAQQNQIRTQLANIINGSISQILIPTVDNNLIVAYEVVVANAAVRNLIRKGEHHQLYNVLYTGRELGMISLEARLTELYRKGIITKETAYRYANNKEVIARMIE
ncbi:MAG: type IV pilus twitching motility protein PilT [Candidatus Calescibacterium sp.]|nr:type IV pilus twitching motility protein PilT [Candidatus Calescibacterium sp.]MCX7972107.1 type IV pilus twitching motility protein PilT [bacterium]MDW8194795.1 type IV pilus twitching motility protein PilT [Candidatus Calescibacterium sp.]